MSITRIFRVRIHPALKPEFEEKFSTVSVRAVAEAQGLLAVSILKATKWSLNEYAIISHWENVDALEAFAGEQWNHAVIPPGMEKYVVDCWVHRYDAWAED